LIKYSFVWKNEIGYFLLHEKKRKRKNTPKPFR
jgi:hypothetical protein